MARSFRLYEKKRGNRWTGSKRFGTLGEGLFFGASFLLGCCGLVVLLGSLVIPEWRVNHAFVETSCTVLKKRASEALIQYQVGGQTWVVWTPAQGAEAAPEPEKQQALSRFAEGGRYPCWYDPSDPQVAVLQRGYTWWLWLALSVPTSLILIGGGGVVYTVLTLGTSAERRAARLKPAEQPDRAETGDQSPHAFPYVPAAAPITDSPGTTLAFRLPMAGSPAWTLGLWLAACLLWNGIVVLFGAVAITGLWEGNPDWLSIAFLIPFVLIGIGLVVVFLRQLVRAAAIGPTLLEISDQPLYPGHSYELFVSQTGRLRVNWLDVLLVCEEEATYRHGTNTRTETRRVFEQTVFRQQGFQVRPGEPLTARFAVQVPATAMHSFKAPHNEINWKLLVRGKIAGRPDLQRSFPVIVCPNGNRKDRP